VQFIALDDFDGPVSGLGGGRCDMSPAITRVGEDPQDEGEQSSRALVEDEARAVAILNAGRMNGGTQQQAERIYENVALLTLDLFAGIVSMRIVRPPFSALLTLWLSMMAAVGLAWRSSCSRHSP